MSDATPRLTATIDGAEVTVADGTTILQACGGRDGAIPTLCFGDTTTPRNACRLCVVEVDGSRTLVPACSRHVEADMVVHTRSERVDHARRMVLEFLGSSVDLSLTANVVEWNAEYGADPHRYGADAQAASAKSWTLCASGSIWSATAQGNNSSMRLMGWPAMRSNT